ncbi:hypothetical protein [Clostridium minihomine]|uniref:hypothetical protein n=1 Tax=Clostridium minihomine TaxID=2045012 RepID=UPI0013ECFC8E|nr:hypothetical protein [Clostridium minihomine]
MSKERIHIAKPDDRESVIVILARNGYTVRQGREKNRETGKAVAFVEYWRDEL